MTDDPRAARIVELIRPLVVKPGSRVDLPHDFDPAYKMKGLSPRGPRAPGEPRRYLTGNGFKVVKIFLNLSREEQRARFLPEVSEETRRQLLEVRRELEAQAPKGAPADPFTAQEQLTRAVTLVRSE